MYLEFLGHSFSEVRAQTGQTYTDRRDRTQYHAAFTGGS